VVIVNNNCTDDTDGIIEKYSTRLPIKRVFEPKSGHSFARNAAVGIASGDLLLWTDDDVVVDANWMNSYVEGCERFPDSDFFGGPVLPLFESGIPLWMVPHWPHVSHILAIREPHGASFQMKEGVIPVGANMACRMSIAKKFRFNSSLGRSQNSLVGGDESSWFEELLSCGYRGAWIDEAKLHHFIPSTRLTKDYVKRWFYGAGAGAARRQCKIKFKRIFGFPLWAVRVFFIENIKEFLFRSTNSARWFRSFGESARSSGYLHESRRLWRGSTRE
jgi:glycosyltransferase involved in cell wall biosynthesis